MSPADSTEPSEISQSDSDLVAGGEATISMAGEGGIPAMAVQIPTIGTKIGKYELKEKLGTGGMSVVYKAHDLALDRYVALKLLLPQAGDRPIDSMRFQQEAKAASRLEHPNIVKVHDFNVTEDGAPYLVMSYLHGVSLSDLIKREGGLQPGRWLSIMIQACDALSCAHENNVVHRDIKPSNFVLCQEKGNEILKLVDFGIAKIETNDDQSLTKTGEVFGSPLYMSPEQCAGSKVDARSDVYSLGCVMYEALAGKPPLSGDNALATIVKHLQDTPVSLANVCRNVPQIESIDKIVMKCLEKKPDDRYSDTVSVRKELERLFLGRKVLGKSPNYRRMKIAAGIVLLTVFGFIAFNVFAAKSEKEKEVQALFDRKQKRAKSRELFWSARKHMEGKKFDIAKSELLQSLELATSSDESPIYIASVYLEFGNIEKLMDNKSIANSYYKKVADWPLPLSEPAVLELKFLANRQLGDDARMRMELPKAKTYFVKALEHAERLGKPREKVIALLEVSDLTENEAEAKEYMNKALSQKGDHHRVEKEIREFYLRRAGYRFSDKVKAQMDLQHKEKAERRRLKEEKRKREEAEEKASDHQADLKTEQIKKFWSEDLIPEKQ